MKISLCAFVALLTLSFSSMTHAATGRIVVANRDAGTISVIDAATDIATNITLPGIDPEPMYVSYSSGNNRVFVGDQNNNSVVVYDANTFSVVDTITTGNGLFHQWTDPTQNQFWVVNTADDTVTVSNPLTSSFITTVSMPTDLVNDGGTPHDIKLDPTGDFAYVTMVGQMSGANVLVKYNTNTFAEVDRTDIGSAAHLGFSIDISQLYVTDEGNNEVIVLDSSMLNLVTTIMAPGVHGDTFSPDGTVFYSTNPSGGGTDGLIAVDTTTDSLLSATDTPFGTPHNIAISIDGSKAYITHSGAVSDAVSIFDVSNPMNPMLLGSVNTGLNPFGIAAIPAVIPEPTSLVLLSFGAAGLMLLRRSR